MRDLKMLIEIEIKMIQIEIYNIIKRNNLMLITCNINKYKINNN